MALLNAPPLSEQMIGDDSKVFGSWGAFFMQVFRGTAFYGSGTTAQRPALKDLKAGGYYLDTTLVAAGQPIWVNSTATGWVNYAGVAV